MINLLCPLLENNHERILISNLIHVYILCKSQDIIILINVFW